MDANTSTSEPAHQKPDTIDAKDLSARTNTLTPDLLRKMNAYWRAANCPSAGQIYLYDNPLLKEAWNGSVSHCSRKPTTSYRPAEREAAKIPVSRS